MILAGIELNKAFGLHRDLLLNLSGHFMKDNQLSMSLTDKITSVKQIEFIVKKLEQDEALRPVKIMGLRTDSNLLSKILAVLLSGILTIFRSLIQ